jgi:hypothetical protein
MTFMNMVQPALRDMCPDDLRLIHSYCQSAKAPLSDLNATAMISWRNPLNLKFLIEDSVLYVVGYLDNLPYLWGPPLGESVNLGHITFGQQLIHLLRQGQGTDKPYCLYVWQAYLLWEDIQKQHNVEFVHQSTEYLYNSHALATLHSPQLKSKRQAKDRFIRRNRPRILNYSKDISLDCLQLLTTWRNRKLNQVGNSLRRYIQMEVDACNAAIMELDHLEGVAVSINNQVVAFSIGCSHHDGTFNCLFEKADANYPDAYSYVFSELGRYCENRFNIINAGEDLGIGYLREAKQKWCPSIVRNIYSLRAHS